MARGRRYFDWISWELLQRLLQQYKAYAQSTFVQKLDFSCKEHVSVEFNAHIRLCHRIIGRTLRSKRSIHRDLIAA